IIGAGHMGDGMISQLYHMKGMQPSLVIDRDVESARECLIRAGYDPKRIEAVKSEEEADASIRNGKFAIASDYLFACKAKEIDCVVDATGVITAGAQIAYHTIMNRKNIVMLNAETDCVIGPILKKIADEQGVIYTGSAGDEPGAVMSLYDFADAMGFEIKVIGKGKNNALDFECTPESVKEEALQKGTSAHMLTSFKEGTKTMVEMVLMCNATGFKPDVRGGHGITSNIRDLSEKYCLVSEGGVLNGYKVVDFVNGIAPGVFAIISHPAKSVNAEMKYLGMGDGPNYVLYRPYHLCGMETPLSVAMAVLEQKPTLVPLAGPVAEVITIAKKDLKPGEYMDGFGMYTCYGLIEEYHSAKAQNAVPIGLIDHNTKVLKEIKKGEMITYDMVEIDKSTLLYQLRKLQEETFDTEYAGGEHV
ncbi:MAG: NAD(P)-dependent oxidoreductase, partial [Bacillota bacterium]|nr:NAD(P)-dependent oxidoreductase [Bacillota bacterium]